MRTDPVCSRFSISYQYLFVSGDSDDKKLTKTDVILLVFGLCLLAFFIVIGAVGYKWHKRSKKRGLYDEV